MIRLRSSDLLSRAQAAVLVALVLAGAVGGALVSQLLPRSYVATSRSFVALSSAATLRDLDLPQDRRRQVIESYAHVATAPFVLDDVIRTLHLPVTARQLADRVTVAPQPDTTVLQIRVADPSPTTAASIANAVGRRLSTAAATLAPSGRASSEAVRVVVIQQAVVPRDPVVPNTPLDVVLGGLAGLALGVLLISLRRTSATPAA